MRPLYQALLAAAAACFTAATPVCAQVAVEESQPAAGQVLEIEIPAPSLRGNLLGSPVVQFATIYLPPSYAAEPERRYPVVYVLHGFDGTDRTWLIDPDAPPRVIANGNAYSQAGWLDAQQLDAIFADTPDMILVSPSGRNIFKHGNWSNSPVAGNWQDFVTQDLVGYVDAHFRTIPERSARGVTGHSGGGHGSLSLAMHSPDTFSAVYAMAPCCLGPNTSFPAFTQEDSNIATPFWQQVMDGIAELEGPEDLPPSTSSQPTQFFMAVELSAAASFSPNPDSPPFYGDLQFRREDGTWVLDEEVMERRRAHWLYWSIAESEDALRSLDALMIDYGENDIPFLVSGASRFVQQLGERGVPLIFEVYPDGDHNSHIAERLLTVGLPFFAQELFDEGQPESSRSAGSAR